jgi:hypothetical protein
LRWLADRRRAGRGGPAQRVVVDQGAQDRSRLRARGDRRGGLTKLPDDTVFWYIANDADGGDPYTTSLKNNRIWKSLPFVEDGSVHRFPDSIWMFGGPASMMQFLDAVQAAVKA